MSPTSLPTRWSAPTPRAMKRRACSSLYTAIRTRPLLCRRTVTAVCKEVPVMISRGRPTAKPCFNFNLTRTAVNRRQWTVNGPLRTSFPAGPRSSCQSPRATRRTLLHHCPLFNVHCLLSLFQNQQTLSIDHIPVQDQGRDAAHVPDVHGWVFVHHEDVGAPSGRHLPDIVPIELDRV